MTVQWFSCVFLLILFSNYGSTQFYNNRPYPTYSLESMPNTGFSCRDKILGGYYADPETQCQMFHVCVKVAGVGVQDFRFLCPNGTAFDQDAQICAEWDDVDCEATTLYYSSDNFDLYRIGSGFETKAAFPGEEESAFHLQRADTGDIRLQKEQRINQKPEYNIQNNKPKPTQKSYTNTNDREIFRGASSSNFFNNRNGGKEDDYDNYDNTGSARNEVPKDQKQVKKIVRRPSIAQTTVQSTVANQNQPSTTTLKPNGFKRIQPRPQAKAAQTPTTVKPISPTSNAANTNEQYTTVANNFRRRQQGRGYNKDTSFRQQPPQENQQQNYNSQKVTNTASTGFNNNYNANSYVTSTTQKYNYNQQNSNDFRYSSTPAVTTTYYDKTNYYGNNEQQKTTTVNKNYNANANYNTKLSTTTLAPTYNNYYTNPQTTAVNYDYNNQQGNNNNNYYNSAKTTVATNYNTNYNNNQYNNTNYYNNNKYTTTESSTNYQTNYYTQPQNKQQYNTNYNNYNSKVTTTLKPAVQQTTNYTNSFNSNYQTKQNNYYNEKTDAETTQYTQSYTKVNQYNNQYSSTVKPTTYDYYNQNGYYNNNSRTNNNYAASSTKKYYDYDANNNYYDNGQYYNTNNYEKATTYNPKGGKAANTGGDDTETLKTAHSINFASNRNNYYNTQQRTATSTTEKSSPKESPRPFAPVQQSTTTLKSVPKKSQTPAIASTNNNNKPQKTQDDDKSYDYAYYDTNDSHFNDYDNIGTEFSKTTPKRN